MNSGFITQMKDKNGDMWYHQIVVETQQQEIERLKESEEYHRKGYAELYKRIDEAIEELENAYTDISNNNNVNYVHKAFQSDLLDILKGVDKE